MRRSWPILAMVALLGCLIDPNLHAAKFQPERQRAAFQSPWWQPNAQPERQRAASPSPWWRPNAWGPARARESIRRGRVARSQVRRQVRHHVARVRGRHVGKTHSKRHVLDRLKLAEKRGYKRASDLVHFPKFFPGLGIILVKPGTLPTGPWLCFDRKDRLVATVYMLPIKDIDDHKPFAAAGPGFDVPIDHATMYFNPGHPGVNVPHYHIVLWHVTKAQEARVAR